jgi:pimeloyl-ACP methyl ester carboxylesterase
VTALSLLRAQGDAVAVLAAALEVPGAEFVARRARTPRLDEERVAGMPTTVVRPSSKPPWPALVFANGATSEGRRHPLVRRLAWGFGWAGFLTYVPDLPGVALGELTVESLAAAVAVSSEAAGSAEARSGRVALSGISTGATLSLLTASTPELAARVSAVAVVAPFTDLEKVIMLATTGLYAGAAGLVRYTPPPYLLVALTRSLAATLPAGSARDDLCAELRALDGNCTSPLEPLLRRSSEELGPDGVAVRALLSNVDPARFDDLYGAAPAAMRDAVERLSPVRSARGLQAPTGILSAPRDNYFPLDEALAITRIAPRARVSVSSVLGHATPSVSLRTLGGLAAMNGFIVRSLAAARS